MSSSHELTIEHNREDRAEKAEPRREGREDRAEKTGPRRQSRETIETSGKRKIKKEPEKTDRQNL